MNAQHPLYLLAKINTTIAGNYRFKPYYTNGEITALIQFGQTRGFEIELIHDLICTGCRKGKFIKPFDLMQQMRNYQDIILPRAFPYGFHSAERFAQFCLGLKAKLLLNGLSTQDLRIHGSSLRNPEAKDVDILLVLNKAQFQQLGQNCSPQRTEILNQELVAIQKEYNLRGLDLIIVEDQTYFPNRPYLRID